MNPLSRPDPRKFVHPFQRITITGSCGSFGCLPKFIEFTVFLVSTLLTNQPCAKILIDFFRIVMLNITVDYVANIILHKVVFIIVFRNTYINITIQEKKLREDPEENNKH